MASKIKVDQIEGQSGTTVTLPSGQTLDLSSGSVTLPNNAVDLASGKVTGTIPVTKGGTGLTSLGTAGQVVQVNSGASALEFADASGGKTLQVVRQTYSGTANINDSNLNGTTFGDYPTNVEISITPQSPTSIIKIEKMFHYYSANNGSNNWNHLYEKFMYKYSSSSPTTYTNIPSAKGNGCVNTEGYGGYLGTVISADHSGQTHSFWVHQKPYVVLYNDHDTPSGETLTYKLQVRSAHSGSSMDWKVNYEGSNIDDGTTGIIILTELNI